VPDLLEEQRTLVGRDRLDQIRVLAVQCRSDEVLVVGGEITVVVVDVDEVDVVAFPGHPNEPDHRIDDLGDVRHQQFGVVMPVRVQHVDDEHCRVAHHMLLPRHRILTLVRGQ